MLAGACRYCVFFFIIIFSQGKINTYVWFKKLVWGASEKEVLSEHGKIDKHLAEFYYSSSLKLNWERGGITLAT